MAVSKDLDRTFKVTIIAKGLDGLLEVIVGLALLVVKPSSINHWVQSLTRGELAQDPTDFFARHLVNSASHLSASGTLYGSIYLLAHGVAKVVLVVLLLRNRLWAYPGMIALLLAFIAYQCYQLTTKLSVGIILLTLFDALVAYLTWREYKGKRQDRAQAQEAQAGSPA